MIWRQKVEKIVIPAPKKLSIFKIKGSTSAHPIKKDEMEAINGPYLEFADLGFQSRSVRQVEPGSMQWIWRLRCRS